MLDLTLAKVFRDTREQALKRGNALVGSDDNADLHVTVLRLHQAPTAIGKGGI